MVLLCGTSFGQDKDYLDKDTIIFVTEPMPNYRGGYSEMHSFIKKNLKYQKDSRDVEGKVFIEFVVNEDGSLSDFKILKGLIESLNNRALEAVKKMPNWIPAKRDDKPFRTKMIIPITFER